MSIQQPRLNLLLRRFKSSTRHVRLSNGLNLLQSILVTELIKCIVALVQELKQINATVALDKVIKVMNIDEDNGHFTFFVREVLLA